MKVGDRVRTVTLKEIAEEGLVYSSPDLRIEETSSGMLNEPYGTVREVSSTAVDVVWDRLLLNDFGLWNADYLRVVCKAELLEPTKPVCVCPDLFALGHKPDCHEIEAGTYAERARRGW